MVCRKWLRREDVATFFFGLALCPLRGMVLSLLEYVIQKGASLPPVFLD